MAPSARRSESAAWWQTAPWWAAIIVVVLAAMAAKVFFDPDYELARKNIFPGVWLTMTATFYTFAMALVLGLLVGIGQVSQLVVVRNLAKAYVELIRGIPVLPLIFTLALVVIPELSEAAGQPNVVPVDWRAMLALAIIYGAYMAEIFRGGLQGVAIGQTEAGKALGLNRRQIMGSIVLPQAARTMLPPVANDFIAILKDTSLLSVLGTLEITRRTRQYGASTFKFPEAYLTMTFLYLVLVLSLSFLLSRFERWMTRDQRNAR